ncbi:hypothetical protein C0Q70_07030 [Pomacea canaliculata]|uniref:Uncharacterized protein n=1 Tax=Pomacea canaliculata TaxID=400727 RepID=A0A2T7PDW3_POMCA|nr:hypothetical protein C0Q70_07030 [Pomacea canaliculata]
MVQPGRQAALSRSRLDTALDKSVAIARSYPSSSQSDTSSVKSHCRTNNNDDDENRLEIWFSSTTLSVPGSALQEAGDNIFSRPGDFGKGNKEQTRGRASSNHCVTSLKICQAVHAQTIDSGVPLYLPNIRKSCT